MLTQRAIVLLSCALFPFGKLHATDLTRAIRLEDSAAVERLLNQGKDINGLDAELLSPLYYAAVAGHQGWVKSLLGKGGKPDVAGQSSSPLTAATLNNDVALVKLLLDAGAEIPDSDAEKAGDGVSTNKVDGKTVTFSDGVVVANSRVHPAAVAMVAGSVDVLKLMLARKPDLNLDQVYEWSGTTSVYRGVPSTNAYFGGIHDAIVNRNFEMARFLIDRGCRIEAPSNLSNVEPLTPAVIAAIEGGELCDPLVDALVARGATWVRRRFQLDPSMLEVEPWDGLTAAARQGNLKRVKQFMPLASTLSAPYRSFLLRYAQNSGSKEVLEFVKVSLGPPFRSEAGIPKGFEDPDALPPTVEPVMIPRRSPKPALKAPKDPVVIAVLSSPGAENAGTSLSSLLSTLPGWTVVDRELVSAALQEKSFSSPWEGGGKDFGAMGDRLAADTLLLVSKSAGSGAAWLRIEVVDVRTGLSLRRFRVPADKFDPKSFTDDIAAEVVSARERFESNGGRIAAISVLEIAGRPGAGPSSSLSSLVRLGLREEIDSTPGAVSIERDQMQPLIEEKTLAGQDSMWSSAWSLQGGVESLQNNRFRIELRAVDLQSGKSLDVSSEAADPGALAHEVWQKFIKASGVLSSSASPSTESAQREASQIIKEAEWLMQSDRFAEAVQAVDAAYLLRGSAKELIPMRIRTKTLSLPNASWDPAKKTFLYPESSQPMMGLRMLSKISQFQDLASLLERSLIEAPEILKGDKGNATNPQERYAYFGAWVALQRLVTYRLSLPELELSAEESMAIRDLDGTLDRVEERLFTLLSGSENESGAFRALVLWLKEVDLSRIPSFQARLSGWMERLLAESKVEAPGFASSYGDLLSGRYSRQRNNGPRFILAGKFLQLLEKSNRPFDGIWASEIKVMLSHDRGRAAAIREWISRRVKLSAEGKNLPPQFLRPEELNRWLPMRLKAPSALPSSPDAFLPELVIAPKVVPEFLTAHDLYFSWRSRRQALAAGSKDWLGNFIKAFPKSNNRRFEGVGDLVSRDQLWANSYREVVDPRGLLDLVHRTVSLPEKELGLLRSGIESAPGLAPDVGFFGEKQWIPEIRFKKEVEATRRVALFTGPKGSSTVISLNGLARDEANGDLWFGGLAGKLESYELSAWSADRSFHPWLVRLAPDSGSLKSFEAPATTDFRSRDTSLAATKGFCVMSIVGEPLMGARTDQDRVLPIGDELKLSRIRSGMGAPRTVAALDGAIYALADVGSPEAMNGEGGDVICRLHKLLPGQEPVVIAEERRLPNLSPLDDPKNRFHELSVRNSKLFLDTTKARTQANANGRFMAYSELNAGASYDPQSGKWSDVLGEVEVKKQAKAEFDEAWRRERGYFEGKGGPFMTWTLSDGRVFGVARSHVPGQLVFRGKGEKPEENRDFYVPISLPLGDSPAPYFRLKVFDGKGNERKEHSQLITAAEFIRTAYVRPLVLGQTEDALIVTLQCGDSIPLPSVWYLPKVKLEEALLQAP